MAAARWIQLQARKVWSATLRAAMHGRSGVYVIRVRATKRVLYVGESHTGRAWKTMLRHFQGIASGLFEDRAEWVCKYCDPSKLEAAFFPCAASQAIALERRKVALYKPTYGTRTPGESSSWLPF